MLAPNEYMDPHDRRPWSDTEPSRVLKAFWTNVKSGGKRYYCIKRVYTTGITPLLLSDLFSGANNISFDPRMSSICGLTRSDVQDALSATCNDEQEVQKHLKELGYHVNSYHFCQR